MDYADAVKKNWPDVARLFPNSLRLRHPEIQDDLSPIRSDVDDLAIHGKTRHLNRLAGLSRLKRLWVYRVNQESFDTIARQVNPKVLFSHEARVRDLSRLEALSNLEELALEWNTKATALFDLGALPRLRKLSLEDLPNILKLDALRACRELDFLRIEGGMWSAFRVETLDPLRSIESLTGLRIANIRVLDDSLAPLSDLKNLRWLSLSNQFPTAEYARLSVYLPETECRQFQPWVQTKGIAMDGNSVMVTGKRKPFLNPITDRDRLHKYEKQFTKFQEHFRAQQ